MSVRASSVDGMDAPTPSTGPQGPVVTREPRTHDFGPGSRAWGHDYTITKVIDGGRRLHVTGWGPSMEVGDFILLANGARASRYRIAEYEPVMGVFVVFFVFVVAVFRIVMFVLVLIIGQVEEFEHGQGQRFAEQVAFLADPDA